MLTVADIMTRNVFTLAEGASASGALWALRQRDIGGAPVHDEAGRLVGVVSRSDFEDCADEGASDVAPTVAEVMTPAVLAVGPDDDAAEAVALMATHHVQRVIVVDDEGHLVGIVTPADCIELFESYAAARRGAAVAEPQAAHR